MQGGWHGGQSCRQVLVLSGHPPKRWCSESRLWFLAHVKVCKTWRSFVMHPDKKSNPLGGLLSFFGVPIGVPRGKGSRAIQHSPMMM